MYSLLGKRVEKFKNNLKEEEEMRHNIKDTVYY